MNQVSFQNAVKEEIELSTQVEEGKEIDRLLTEIANMKFEELPNDYQSDQADRKRFKIIKNVLIVTSVTLAVAAVVAAIASIVISAGAITGGAVTLALVSGGVGVSAAFKQLDGAFESFVAHRRESKKEGNRITKLRDKINKISCLVKKRMETLKISDAKEKWNEEILSQVRTINKYIRKIKEQVPEKSELFDEITPIELLGVA